MGLQIAEQLARLNPRGAYVNLTDMLQLRFAAQDLQLFSRRPVKSQLNGPVATRFRGRGMDFEEVRLYQAGDDVRSIDWRVTARTQVPHTKLYREERERPVFVLTDQRAPMFFGSQCCFKSVLAAHITASLAWAALSNGDRIGGLIFGANGQRDIRPRRSKHAVLELLQQLQEFNLHLQTPIAAPEHQSLRAVLSDARRIAKPGCAVFLVSDFYDYDSDCEQQLFELARHTDVTLMQVYDPLEQHLRSNTQLTLSNGETRLRVPSDQAAFQKSYQQVYERRLDLLTRSANRLGLPLLSYATTDNLQLRLRQRFCTKK